MKATALLLILFSLSASLQRAGADVFQFPAASGFSFEGILTQTQHALDGDPASGDGAVHRGAVSLTITKRGAVSGRLRYNELLPSDGSPLGMYRPVVRAFSGVLKPTNSAPLKYDLTAPLGVGTNSGRQRLVLEADYSGSVPTVTVQVHDQVSANADGGLGFSSQSPPLAGIHGGEPPAGALGRFVLTTEDAYLLVQNLRGGRLLWSTRMPGYSNSGSALVATSPAGTQSATLYESKTNKSPAGSAVNSLIGTLNLLPPEEPFSKWTACAGDTTFPGGLDWQSSLAAVPSTDAGEGSSAAATPNAPFCERGLLPLAPEKSFQWVQRNGASLPSPDLAALLASGPAVFTLQDYSLTDAQGAPTLHSWNVSYSAGGLVAAGVPVDGVSPPTLSLRLASERGEITGFYGAAGARRRPFKGVALLSEGMHLSATGWLEPNETEGSNLSTWSLQIPPRTAPTFASAAAYASPTEAPSAVAAAASGSEPAAAADDCLPPLILPPPLIGPPPLILPPPIIDPPPLILPPPLIDPPPLILPPPLIDPPPLILPPPLIDPPPLILPPPLITPPPLILPPTLIDPPPLILPPPLCPDIA